MARYAPKNKPNLLDVLTVYRQYSERWRTYSGFGSKGGMKSDYDLWDEGKPALNLTGTVSEGIARLTFTFRDTNQRDAEHWMKDFVNAYSLPYTSIEVGKERASPIQGNDHTYIATHIQYAEHESQK